MFNPVIDEMTKIFESLQRHAPYVVFTILLGIIFYMLGNQIKKGLRVLWSKKFSNPFVVEIVSQISIIPLYVLFAYLLLVSLGLQSAAFTIIGGTGIAGLVISFAFKGIAENFLSGLVLILRCPFEKGDNIQVGGMSGVVQNLDTRGTTIIDSDGNVVLIPNSIVLQSILVNKTTNPLTRGALRLPVEHTTDHESLIHKLKQTIENTDGVVANPKVFVGLDTVSHRKASYQVYFWLDSKTDTVGAVKSAVFLNCIKCIEQDQVISNSSPLPSQSLEQKVEEKFQHLQLPNTRPQEPSSF